MVLTKEYRVCMPMTVEEYRIGQLYMIARHSLEQSGNGEGVEVIENKKCENEEHGTGQFTEKRIHLSSRLPYWVQTMIPKIFYVTEKAWNYFPYTITEYTCNFVPKFNVTIYTSYKNDNGCTENCLDLTPEQLAERLVEYIDIAYDELNPRHYKEEEDPRYFQSHKTHRGPLVDGWRNNFHPIMCSYKVVNTSFEVWGFQTKVEDYVHSCIRDVLLLGHRQAFAWIDEWIDMSYDDVKKYECNLQKETNTLLQHKAANAYAGGGDFEAQHPPSTPGTPKSPKSPAKKSYFSWFS